MPKKLLISLLSFVLPVAAGAAQIKEALPDGEIEALIAADELSRIKVVGDRIKSVRSRESEIEIVEDRDLGEIYLHPNTDKPINIFVTTERNNTYKLLLVPKRVPAEQIFIRGLDEMLANSKTHGPGQKSESFKEKVITLIRSMVLEKDCAGFKRVETAAKDVEIGNTRLKEEVNYLGLKLKGQVFEIIDDSEIDEGFAERQEGIVAISVVGHDAGRIRKLYLVSLTDKDEEVDNEGV